MAEPKKTNWDRLDVEIQHEGRAITLPNDPDKMPINKAIEALVRKQQDEEQIFRVFEIIDAYPFDAAVACTQAMINLYGWASPQTEITQSMFGISKNPPVMISVKTGVKDDDVVQCPLGAFKLPGVDELVQTRITKAPKDRQVFVITGEIKKRSKHLVLELANEARRIVKEQSIYRGKAIRLSVNYDGNLDLTEPPTFMDVSANDEIVFDDSIQEQINHSILSPIMFTKDVKGVKTPLKRGILLEGPYGTGKSLTARMTARVCEENGWTFVLLDKVQGLKAALEFANRYAPAVVFAEDIDRVMGERDESANDLINTIDGVVSKRAEIMTILTTNFVEKIDPVILRPGRLDAVISLRAPTNEAVERLLRVYAGKLLDASADLSGAVRELSGQIPASIRECVERAKLGMIWRRASKLSDSDVVTAAKTMKNHLALLNRDVKKPTAAERLAESLQEVVLNGRGEKIDLVPSIQEMVVDINERV